METVIVDKRSNLMTISYRESPGWRVYSPMMISRIAKMILLAGIVACAIAVVMAQAIGTQVPRKILFVGDSFTYFQNGIYTHFERLAATANSPVAVAAGKSVFGGAFLHRLWD
jgi:hypothetical protein